MRESHEGNQGKTLCGRVSGTLPLSVWRCPSQ